MRGNRQKRFDLRTAGTDMPFDEAHAVAYAAAHGVDEPAFQALPDAAKYAWSWRAFNEPAYDALASQPNVHIVLYEALCADPETLTPPSAGLRRSGLEPADRGVCCAQHDPSGRRGILRCLPECGRRGRAVAGHHAARRPGRGSRCAGVVTSRSLLAGPDIVELLVRCRNIEIRCHRLTRAVASDKCAAAMSVLTRVPRAIYDRHPDVFNGFEAIGEWHRGTALGMAWLSQLAYEADNPQKISEVLRRWGLSLVGDVIAPMRAHQTGESSDLCLRGRGPWRGHGRVRRH